MELDAFTTIITIGIIYPSLIRGGFEND